MTLHIDIETFSSVDIKTAGVYKYVEAPDFEVLLISWYVSEHKVLGLPESHKHVCVIDLALMAEEGPDAGEIQEVQDFVQMLTDPTIIKKAWNANFERTALSKYFGVELPPEQWQCTMIQAARCSLPLSLDACSRALGVEEKQKDGKALIRYFCTPCKPTKANGGRTRNLPHHDPEKWGRFKQYCKQDVVVEMQIDEKARFYPTSSLEHALWNLDQRINDRGIKIDPDLVNKAIELDYTYRNKLVAEAKRISNLDNPNSVAQLIEWLSAEMDEDVTTLKKDNIPVLLDRSKSDEVTRILEIRQLMGKTSVKKYKAMAKSVCADGYIRGLFQFYGANRTGRWAGRLVQVQNLPGASLKDLATARELVKAGDLETLEMLYDSVPDLLSQLIRTAFIGPFDVADFSAIEARVIAWLAAEQWRLDVFNGHGKIYEASASQMFGIPIEKVDKKLRQKGKIAELALGYQGGVNALIQMGALKMGLQEDELQPIVTAWRIANPKIKQLWYDMQKAAVSAVETPGQVCKAGRVEFRTKGEHLIMKLPSGRMLVYWKAHLEPGEYGQQIKYYGMDQTTKKWGRQTTYGGKLVENCLAGDTRVLTRRGWLQITKVTDLDTVWDGEAWVTHAGLIDKGVQKVITVNGVKMTPDHKILTYDGWKNASQSKRYNRVKVELPDGSEVYRFRWEKVNLGSEVRLRQLYSNCGLGVQEREAEIVRVYEEQDYLKQNENAWVIPAPLVLGVALNETEMHKPAAPSMAQLRRPGDKSLRQMDSGVSKLLGRHVSDVQGGFGNRPHRREWGLQKRKLPMGYLQDSIPQQAPQQKGANAVGFCNSGRSRGTIGYRSYNTPLPISQQMPDRKIVRRAGCYEQVYDLLNCGPKNRFTVMGADGPMIVHNCTQAIARDVLAEAMLRLDAEGYNIRLHVHDEIGADSKDYKKMAEIMGRDIDWAKGLPLKAEAYETFFYRKD